MTIRISKITYHQKHGEQLSLEIYTTDSKKKHWKHDYNTYYNIILIFY